MVKIGGNAEDQQVAPDLLAAPIREAVMLDALWAYYFATGNPFAVRKIVSVLGLVTEAGAAQAYEASEKTVVDLERANHDTMYQAASWSIAALMKEHPPLLELCERLFEMPDLSAPERLGLAIAMEHAAPERWRVSDDPATRQVTVQRLTDAPVNLAPTA
jgi:hypothetical protein